MIKSLQNVIVCVYSADGRALFNKVPENVLSSHSALLTTSF